MIVSGNQSVHRALIRSTTLAKPCADPLQFLQLLRFDHHQEYWPDMELVSLSDTCFTELSSGM